MILVIVFHFFFLAISHSKSADSFSRYCNHPIYFLFKFDIMWSALVKWLHLLCDEHVSVQFQNHPVTMTTAFYQSAYSLLLLIWAIGNNPYQSVFFVWSQNPFPSHSKTLIVVFVQLQKINIEGLKGSRNIWYWTILLHPSIDFLRSVAPGAK